MISLPFLSLLLFFLLAGMFGLARWAEKRNLETAALTKNASLYALSLTIYCTSWTYYGSIGEAAKTGGLFLAVYLGPTITLCFWRPLMERFTALRDQIGATSYVDIIVARHSGSRFLGAFSSFFLFIGLVPYIALQIKSISQTVQVLTGHSSLFLDLGISVFLVAFTISYGLAHFNNRKSRFGLIFVMVAESVVKLLGILFVGVYVCFIAFGHTPGVLNSIFSAAPSTYGFIGVRSGSDAFTWISWLLLSSSAILFLPRQFHVAVVENGNRRSYDRARWLFPLYLFLINLFILPIAMYGLRLGLPASEADTFLLRIPMLAGMRSLSVCVFVGGFFASLGMIIVETIALSLIMMNGVIAPLVAGETLPPQLKPRLLEMRWFIAASILILAFLWERVLEPRYSLAPMGLISFVAVLQFAPVTLGTIFWRRSGRMGAIFGICSGALVWFYTLIVPVFLRVGGTHLTILTQGPWGLSWLRPESLFGFEGIDNIANAVFWSLVFNVGFYFLGSMLGEQTPEEQLLATRFVDRQSIPCSGLNLHRIPDVPLGEKIASLQKELGFYFGTGGAEAMVGETLRCLGVSRDEKVSLIKLLEFRDQVQSRITSSVGGGAAEMILRRAALFSEQDHLHLKDAYLKIIMDFRAEPMELYRRLCVQWEREEMQIRYNEALRNTVEQVKKELELERLRSVQSAKMSALGQMAAGVAHEINNPLAIVSMGLQNIESTVAGFPNVSFSRLQNTVDVCQRAIARVAKIVSALRSFSRDARNDPFQEIKIQRILDETLNLSKSNVESKGISLSVFSPVGDISLLGHSSEIEQVLVNLISNAVDAIGGKAERWIKIEIQNAADDRFFSLRVTDSGSGVPDTIAEKIMDPFFTTKEVGKGTGIGLSISSEIVERHGGRLYLDRNSRNTCFVVELPKSPGET